MILAQAARGRTRLPSSAMYALVNPSHSAALGEGPRFNFMFCTSVLDGISAGFAV